MGWAESHRFKLICPDTATKDKVYLNMATIGNDNNGRKRILFMAEGGRRKTIRIGKATQRQAESFKVRIEALVGQGITGAVDDETSRWLAALDDKTYARIAAVGLVKPRNRTAVTLKAFMEDCFASFVVKAGTATTYAQTKRCLLEHFGDNRPLREIEPMEGDQWRQWLKAQKLADSTIARRVKMARQIFKRAMKWKLISENPFADVVAGSQSNKERQFFVKRDVIEKVIAACPNTEWKLIVALSRYGGLRCPSEHLALKWTDVDWERNRILVRSSKTEHLEGNGIRFIPLFPELRPYLLELFEAAEPGTIHVINHYRDTNSNLRTQLNRIIERAGQTPWPRLFHNLRATRQTELAESYPIHVVCSWLGNSQAVAQEHYLQITDAHFADAAEASKPVAEEATPVQKPKAAQNPAQSTSGSTSTDQELVAAGKQNSPVLPGYPASSRSGGDDLVTPRGSEQSSKTPENTGGSEKRGTDSGTPAAVSDISDADLLQVIEAWPKLSKHSRSLILAVVQGRLKRGIGQ